MPKVPPQRPRPPIASVTALLSLVVTLLSQGLVSTRVASWLTLVFVPLAILLLAFDLVHFFWDWFARTQAWVHETCRRSGPEIPAASEIVVNPDRAERVMRGTDSGGNLSPSEKPLYAVALLIEDPTRWEQRCGGVSNDWIIALERALSGAKLNLPSVAEPGEILAQSLLAVFGSCLSKSYSGSTAHRDRPLHLARYVKALLKYWLQRATSINALDTKNRYYSLAATTLETLSLHLPRLDASDPDFKSEIVSLLMQDAFKFVERDYAHKERISAALDRMGVLLWPRPSSDPDPWKVACSRMLELLSHLNLPSDFGADITASALRRVAERARWLYLGGFKQ